MQPQLIEDGIISETNNAILVEVGAVAVVVGIVARGVEPPGDKIGQVEHINDFIGVIVDQQIGGGDGLEGDKFYLVWFIDHFKNGTAVVGGNIFGGELVLAEVGR